MAAQTPSILSTPLRFPVPEFAEIDAVVLSAELFEADYGAEALVRAITAANAEVWIASSASLPAAALKRKLAARGLLPSQLARVKIVPLAHGNIWIRDYGPLPVMAGSGQGGGDRSVLFADLRYSDPISPINDQFPQALGQLAQVPVLPIAVELDGGNFLTNGEFCFTSIPDLPISLQDQDSRGRQPTAAALVDLGDQLGCRQTMVVKGPPHPHVDMWAKFLDERTVLVNELTQKTLAQAADHTGQIPADLMALQQNLENQAVGLAKRFQVRRLPMPLPFRGTFRTYTNSLLVNGVAIIPTYRRFGWHDEPYPDTILAEQMEAEVADSYRAAGYKVVFINADHLIFNGGAWRCVTATLPRMVQPRRNAKLDMKGH